MSDNNIILKVDGVNKRFGTQAIISDETLRATDGKLAVRPLGKVQVVGRAARLSAFVLGAVPPLSGCQPLRGSRRER